MNTVAGIGWVVLCLAAGVVQAWTLHWPGPDAAQPMGLVQPLAMAVLCVAVSCAAHGRQAVFRAWAFASAWLLAVFGWLVVSMNTYGGLPWLGAALATVALAAFLGIYTAAAAWLWWRWAQPLARPWRALGLWAALWTLAEMLRGHWFTGFPWGAVGYAHGDTLGPWAPWVGVYGVTAVAAAVAAALANAAVRAVHGRYGAALRWGLGTMASLGLIIAMAPSAQHIALRHTTDSGALKVRLLQGNIGQDEKFNAHTGVQTALTWYPQQISRAWAEPHPVQLVIAPETAFPLLPQQIEGEVWQSVLQSVAESAVVPSLSSTKGGALMLGLPLGGFDVGYTNSVWGMAAPQAEEALQAAAVSSPQEAVQAAPFYRYDKHHLVPFGEFIPPLFRWFTDLMNIPLGDFNRGALVQASWPWGGQRIAAHICYEDLFGEELAAQFAQSQPPTVLVNVSNIAWFGDTVAIDQHLQIARWRAMELGRPVLRATNTGATAVIDHTGVVQALLPRLTRDVLDAEVRGRDGATPYAHWVSRRGLWPLWGLMIALVALCASPVRRGMGRRP